MATQVLKNKVSAKADSKTVPKMLSKKQFNHEYESWDNFVAYHKGVGLEKLKEYWADFFGEVWWNKTDDLETWQYNVYKNWYYNTYSKLGRALR